MMLFAVEHAALLGVRYWACKREGKVTYVVQRISSTVNSVGKQTGDPLKNKDMVVIYSSRSDHLTSSSFLETSLKISHLVRG